MSESKIWLSSAYWTCHRVIQQGKKNLCSLLAVPPSFWGGVSFLNTSHQGKSPSSFSLKVKMDFISTEYLWLCFCRDTRVETTSSQSSFSADLCVFRSRILTSSSSNVWPVASRWRCTADRGPLLFSLRCCFILLMRSCCVSPMYCPDIG